MLVYGKNVVEEILKKNNTIKKAYIYKEFHDSFILLFKSHSQSGF